MTTYNLNRLSGTTTANQHIAITATTSGTAHTIHTAVSGTTNFDEIWLYGASANFSFINIWWPIIYIEVGGTGTADVIITPLLAFKGGKLLLPGVLLNNSLVVKAYIPQTGSPSNVPDTYVWGHVVEHRV